MEWTNIQTWEVYRHFQENPDARAIKRRALSEHTRRWMPEDSVKLTIAVFPFGPGRVRFPDDLPTVDWLQIATLFQEEREALREVPTKPPKATVV